MENVKNETAGKTTPATVNKDVVIEFKSRNELSAEEINTLPKVLIKVMKQVNRTTGLAQYRLFHTITCNNLEPAQANAKPKNKVVNVELPAGIFNETKFELFKVRNNLANQTEFVLGCPYRPVRGKSADGQPYYLYELFLANKLVVSNFYSNQEIELLIAHGGIKGTKFFVNPNEKTIDAITSELQEEFSLADADI